MLVPCLYDLEKQLLCLVVLFLLIGQPAEPLYRTDSIRVLIAEEAPRVSTSIQNELNFEDESASQWVDAGCVEGIDLLLNQPAMVEIDGELLLLTLDAPSTSHGVCILPGSETLARVRLTDLDGATTDWMRVEFERPVPEEPSEGL